jgi:hypothetical protein
MLHGEWYATFFLVNSLVAALQFLSAAATFAAPPGPADTEIAVDSGVRSLLRIVMTIVTLISTLFL